MSPRRWSSRGLSGRGLINSSCDRSACDERVQVLPVCSQGNADETSVHSSQHTHTHTHTHRRGLAIGSTGTFPGGLAADLARYPVFFYYYYYYFYLFFCLPNVPKWSFPIVAFPNKSIINHKSVSLDWQRALHVCSLPPTESMRGTRGRRGNGQKKTVKCSEITNLFRASSAGQFHL